MPLPDFVIGTMNEPRCTEALGGELSDPCSTCVAIVRVFRCLEDVWRYSCITLTSLRVILRVAPLPRFLGPFSNAKKKTVPVQGCVPELGKQGPKGQALRRRTKGKPIPYFTVLLVLLSVDDPNFCLQKL